MRKLKLVKVGGGKLTKRLYRCPVVVVTLDGGEAIKRGCGRSGMSEFDAFLRCLYCGNYLYKKVSSLKSMWFHFRWSREFWKIHNKHGRDFVNGVPVTGNAESLPPSFLPDLAEPNPPRWFPYYLKLSDQEFQEYIFNLKTG